MTILYLLIALAAAIGAFYGMASMAEESFGFTDRRDEHPYPRGGSR